MMLKMELEGLEKRHPGLTSHLAGANYEAACVCLSRHHAPPVLMAIADAGASKQAQSDWQQPSASVRRAWANDIDATEQGAYCVCLAALEASRGLVAITRAHTLSGSDYFVAQDGTDPDDLEEALRLEVSGISDGGSADVQKRVALKKKQAKEGKSSLPALVSVVAFSSLIIQIDDVP